MSHVLFVFYFHVIARFPSLMVLHAVKSETFQLHSSVYFLMDVDLNHFCVHELILLLTLRIPITVTLSILFWVRPRLICKLAIV